MRRAPVSQRDQVAVVTPRAFATSMPETPTFARHALRTELFVIVHRLYHSGNDDGNTFCPALDKAVSIALHHFTAVAI
jgi:hypothetical protein